MNKSKLSLLKALLPVPKRSFLGKNPYYYLNRNIQFTKQSYTRALFHGNQFCFSTQNLTPVMRDYFKELNDSLQEDREAFVDKLEQFSSVIYENMDKLSQNDVADSIKELSDTIMGVKKNQTALYSNLIQILNDIFDAYPVEKMEHQLKFQFFDNLEKLERILKANVNQLNMETLTYAAYYFCKFQFGSVPYWEAVENQILKQRDSLNISQLSRILLSFSMNNRQISTQNWKDLLESVLNKIDKADSKDTFYLCMALGKDKMPKGIVKSDVYYTLYLNVAKNLKDFDLYQIAQLANFFTRDHVSPYIPDEFWLQTLSAAVQEALLNYEKFESKINKEVYLSDLLRALSSFGLRGLANPSFVQKIENFFEKQLDNMDAKMCENLIFFLSRLESGNIKLLGDLLSYIERKKYVENGEIRDHLMLMAIENAYNLKINGLNQQIEQAFIKQFLKQKVVGMPQDQLTEIISLYAFEFVRLGNESSDQFWQQFSKYIKERCITNSMFSLQTLANLSYVLVSKQDIVDESVWEYIQKQIRDRMKSDKGLQENQIEHLCMIVASLQTANKLTQDIQHSFMRVIQQSLVNFSMEEIAKIFATVSRYAQIGESNEESSQFIQLKQELARHLLNQISKLDVNDMLVLCMPLAAEEIKEPGLWDKFRDLTIKNQNNLDFKQYVNIAWSFSKVGYQDQNIWKAIEQAFTKELDAVADNVQAKQHALASICFALKDHSEGVSQEFWGKIKQGLTECRNDFDPENRELVDLAIQDNPNFRR
eukprot:403335430